MWDMAETSQDIVVKHVLTIGCRFASSISKLMLYGGTDPCILTHAPSRMLESPQDESVVRWGNEGDSFVVLEVRLKSDVVVV